MAEESQSEAEVFASEELLLTSKSLEDEEKGRKRREKRRKILLKENEKRKKKGVCYFSRIPPNMDPLKLRQLLSPYAEIQRIYLAPKDPSAQMRRTKSGGFRGQAYSEGWVEFSDKCTAKRVANMLNGEKTGGKKRSQFYFDIWNIKYLSKFKWDDLAEENAHKKYVREQKLHLEINAAKKERDFYLSKVEQSRALSEIEERMKKKRKLQNETGHVDTVKQQKPKVVRQFPQKQPLVKNVEMPKLSKEVLAEVFKSANRE